MKLAYFTDTYLPTRDGVVTSMLSFKEELQKKGHEVYIFCPDKRKGRLEEEKNVFRYASSSFGLYPEYNIAIFPYFANMKFKKLGIDIMHSHALTTMGLAARHISKKEKMPSVATMHTLVPLATHYLKEGAMKKGMSTEFWELILKLVTSWATKRLVYKIDSDTLWKALAWFFQPFDVVISPSQYTRTIMAEHGIQTQVVPNGIDTTRFRPDIDTREFRQRFGLEGKNVVLHVGRLTLEKNLDLLIDAAPLVKREYANVVFLVVGSGPARLHFERRVSEKGLADSFIFTGFLPDDMLPLTYAACNMLAFPSNFETQGLVALEAMGCGKPVVAAKDTAVSEVIAENKNGYLFNGTAEDFANKIAECLVKGARFSKAARETALAYSKEKCVKILISVYEQLL